MFSCRVSSVALLGVVAGVVALGAGCEARRPQASVAAWSRPDIAYQRQTLGYLASDHLEGRGPETRGLDLAGRFIAEQYRKAGLLPAPGRSDYFQTFEFNLGVKPEPDRTGLNLGAGPLALGDDFLPNTLTQRNVDFAGPIVFAGYGIESAGRNYNDFAGLDLKGKVALVLRYEPRNADGSSRFTGGAEWSEEAGLARKILAAQRHGATAVVLVNPPGTPAEDALSPFAGRSTRGSISVPVVQVKRAAVDAMLAARGLTSLADLARSIDATGRPASRELPSAAVTGSLYFQKHSAGVRNVVALLPGSGPRADEYVVVGAHYDHLGYGGSGSLLPGVRGIHHGADDNASGTTAVLTLARRLGAAETRPERSILFISFTVEEQGLIGSEYFVEHSPVPLGKIAYMLNLDMVGRLRNDTVLHGGEGTADTLKPLLSGALQGSGLAAKSFGEGGLGPSDHSSFAQKKIPVLFLFTGLHPDYHRPTDTADKINYPGLQRVTDLAEKLVFALAAAPRSAYNNDADSAPQNLRTISPFGPAPATLPASSQSSSPSSSAERIGLGLLPDMTLRDTPGLRIDAVFSRSPAEWAGLKAEDVLISLDGVPVNSIEDLQAVYDRHQLGDTVEAVYERAGKRARTNVTFARRGAPQT